MGIWDDNFFGSQFSPSTLHSTFSIIYTQTMCSTREDNNMKNG